ncbi:TetR/AcrR family transcriptional regulator [Paenibacillus planticolens]|uniref:TetR family transcriptional regulator n=1 Tax=Paenibacillus planticolens TaxID=2654976 RepID=A0ABX2A027_9BACL|nr:TetR/AcrR family transcriptional regulator [Paenibacillus planticolens]NOV04627.1 TetR family transcriptional regulator [Paenibacillus planticolens]
MKHPEDHENSLNEDNIEANPICGRREERDSEYRQRILSSARTLFKTHNIENVTMHQIAKEAGVGQGTLYRRYAHIGDVCSDLMRSTTTQFLAALEAELAEPKPDVTAMKQLSDFIYQMIDFVDDKASLLATIVSMHTDKRSFSLHKKPLFVRLRSLLAPLLNLAVEQGEIQPIDVTLTVNTILTSLIPDNYLYHREVLGYTKEQFAEGICRIFVKGI